MMTEDERHTLFEPEEQLGPPAERASDALPLPAERGAAEEDARRRNPWALGLWAASAVLMVLATALFVSSLNEQYFGFPGTINGHLELKALTVLTVEAFAPGLFAVGLACALAAALLHGLEWLQRQR